MSFQPPHNQLDQPKGIENPMKFSIFSKSETVLDDNNNINNNNNLSLFYMYCDKNVHFTERKKFTPSAPVPPVTNVSLCSTFDVITFDQNWHHL